ncbi:DUF6504 family protein [Maricaulis sp. MIT060901]|uniref:DUF6504 family protein n=1 Tax=Maricaulis sp. MIT060901 TaxID=3096993 RepID=UPI00399B30B3
MHTTTGGERLYALNAAASTAGLRRGQAVADAKSLEPGLQVESASPALDKRLLQALARACGRWSPWTAPDPGLPGEDGILLDITGCARLFGGEEKLVTATLEAVREQGYIAYAAAAPTLGLAWGLARYAARRESSGFILTDTVSEPLNALPVEALRIGAMAEQLRRFGLKRVGDLAGLPRASLARRFGRELVSRLDQARGLDEEVLSPLQPRTHYRARLRFPEALLLLDSIKQTVRETANTLCEQLDAHGQGLRRAELNLYRVDGKVLLLSLGTAAPARDPAHITRLFSEKLDRAEIDIGFGIDVVELRASETTALNTHQSGLLDSDEMAPDTMARLTDRLVVRLGDDQVQRAARRESHIPERAAGWRQNSGPGSAIVPHAGTARAPGGTALAVRDNTPVPALTGPESEVDPDRPLLILARPEPAQAVAEIPDGPPRSFIWRRVRHLVHRAEGPERLAPEWWRDQLSPRSRDYFRVETREGRRFWLYREGLFGLETTSPEWFVHGAS